MIIIIPYKLDDGLQLKYTLRSIDKYYKDAEVILCGDKPDWFNGSHISRPNDKLYPAQLDSELNIDRGLEVASQFGVKEAVIWHDDIIALQPVQIEADRYVDTLENMIALKPQNKLWYEQTMRVCELYKMPKYAYVLHTPELVDIEKYLYISKEIVITKLMSAQKILPRCIYENLHNLVPKKGNDYKIYDKDESVITSRPFVSTLESDGKAFKEIKAMFKYRSKWEVK